MRLRRGLESFELAFEGGVRLTPLEDLGIRGASLDLGVCQFLA